MDRRLDVGPKTNGDGRGGFSRRYLAASGRPQTISVEFDAGPSAAGSARNALLALDGRLDGTLLEDLRLLVSELVTNSVRHPEIPPDALVRIDVQVTRDMVRVEVADEGGGFEPRPRDLDRNRPGGWGLYLVDRLADRWGVMRKGLTRVWFEIDRAEARAA
jgi:anti-sigma regulatory factor (Ser/Thr protein kinase)